jgi:hypothetical protein
MYSSTSADWLLPPLLLADGLLGPSNISKAAGKTVQHISSSLMLMQDKQQVDQLHHAPSSANE